MVRKVDEAGIRRWRRRGFYSETVLVKLLEKNGYNAVRVPVSNPSLSPLPDVIARKDLHVYAFEVKNAKREDHKAGQRKLRLEKGKLTMNLDKTVVSASVVCKTYQIGNINVEALKDVNLEVEKGEFMIISGPSGSGKTTLLNIIGGIDKPTSGKIIVFGHNLSSEDEDFLSNFRCNNVGFVFQSYNLVSTLTVAENVAFPMEWARKPQDYIENRVEELLRIVNLERRAEHFPFQLSGGEQQRVAFARALANDPPLLLVDEPTGNLDAKTSLKIVQMLQKLKDDGKTIIVATHDKRIIELADQKMYLEDGRLVSLNE